MCILFYHGKRWWSLTVLEINFRFTPELGRIDLKDSGNDHETSALRDEVCHPSEVGIWMASKIG